jgi:ABC-2 type transport system ATP-binding protein
VRRKIINTLSKGYRQRVGLADALVHDPALLILDEPTNGLDPNQIRQVRGLIRELREQHTILISTHILSEVEHLCDRVIILHQGRIQAEGTPAALAADLRTAGLIRVQLKGEAGMTEHLLKLPGVRKVNQTARDEGWLTLEIRTESGSDVREQIYQLANTRGWSLRELARQTATLEDVFAELTHADAA